MLTADYHMHSVSPDARVPMEDMCQAAIDKGLTEVALTDHYEFYAHGIHRKFFHEEYLKMYWDSLERCRERFAGRLTIKSGMEFGQLHLPVKRHLTSSGTILSIISSALSIRLKM